MTVPRKDITGQKIGRLTVLYQTDDMIGADRKHYTCWHCVCDCGNECDVKQKYLFNGDTVSCGCKRKDIGTQHLMDAKINTNEYDLSSHSYGICRIQTGQEFIFDKEDYNKIKIYSWHMHHGYVVARSKDDTDKEIYVQDVIMDNLDKKFIIDHIKTEDKLDNRKCNLRKTNDCGNMQNHKRYSNNTSGVTGVGWKKSSNKWFATINYNKKSIFLGYFVNYNDAVKARKQAEEIYHGEFSYDNSQMIYQNVNNYDERKLK